MKLIVGLGNPGERYANTRHNVGFMVIDELARRNNVNLSNGKFNGLYEKIQIGNEKVIILKPLTYMNLSGESIRPLMDFYKIVLDDILVIYDDLDLPVGKIRLRMKGSAGGHNGIKSTIQHVNSPEFKRIRIGIDRPKNGEAITDYVLGNFPKEEMVDIEQSIKLSADACEKWTEHSFLEVMNMFN